MIQRSNTRILRDKNSKNKKVDTVGQQDEAPVDECRGRRFRTRPVYAVTRKSGKAAWAAGHIRRQADLEFWRHTCRIRFVISRDPLLFRHCLQPRSVSTLRALSPIGVSTASVLRIPRRHHQPPHARRFFALRVSVVTIAVHPRQAP
ncbi:hypothetical protein GWI33_006519 [Rhynchophorus ferrugineus]|uniref:Uncharacterized protein n=1 Tax=Rhynchophorus ferrugineus TaxID=354439 RepID=A0A834MDQ3_RHYFE|nr:hypothetical protein GWI33_006519 [Rhynchophorus ferrugineus]